MAVHFEMKYVQYTELLKENLDVLLPVLTDLVNASLSSGSIDDMVPSVPTYHH